MNRKPIIGAALIAVALSTWLGALVDCHRHSNILLRIGANRRGDFVEMPNAKYTGEEAEQTTVAFGTLFRLRTFMRHGGGKGSLGVVLAVDRGQKWDNYRRPLIVAFEGCPRGRYRLSLDDIEVSQR